MKQKEFSFNNNDFARIRYVIDEELKKVIRQMKGKGLPSGAVSVKIEIGMIEDADKDGVIRQMFIFDPKISSRIGQQFKAKCHAVGGEILVGKDGELLVGRADQVTIDELMEEEADRERQLAASEGILMDGKKIAEAMRGIDPRASHDNTPAA